MPDPFNEDVMGEWLRLDGKTLHPFTASLTREDGTRVVATGETVEEVLVNLWMAEQCGRIEDRN